MVATLSSIAGATARQTRFPPAEENCGSSNRIDTLENDVELKSTSAALVPRDGAVVLNQFPETDRGRSVF